jgi:hypothetical protein
MSKTDKACQALFRGRINIPGAAASCDMTNEEMKQVFSDYVSGRKQEDWELDVVLCWPYA